MSTQLPLLSNVLHAVRSTTDADPKSDQQLADALSLLFEPSPTLTEKIVPLLIQSIRSAPDEAGFLNNYASLIDIAFAFVSIMPDDEKAKFIGAHPRIGEVKGLSALSAAEQGQAALDHSTSAPPSTPTPDPDPVLERLAFLNAMYERRYPGLVYITFVNGRTRAQIRDELELKLREEGILLGSDEPDGLDQIVGYDVRDDAWRSELYRAINAIRDIAHSRREKLGAE